MVSVVAKQDVIKKIRSHSVQAKFNLLGLVKISQKHLCEPAQCEILCETLIYKGLLLVSGAWTAWGSYSFIDRNFKHWSIVNPESSAVETYISAAGMTLNSRYIYNIYFPLTTQLPAILDTVCEAY